MNILGVNHRIGCGVSVHSEAMSDPQYVRVRIIKAKDLLSVNRTGMGMYHANVILLLVAMTRSNSSPVCDRDRNL